MLVLAALLPGELHSCADTSRCESDLYASPSVHLALENDPVMKATLARDYTRIDELLQAGRGVDLIFAAARSGRVDVARYLVSRGVDPNAIDPELGLAPLSAAIPSGCEPMVIALVELGADVNLRYRAGGTTPLWTAAVQSTESMVKTLIRLGADPRIGTSSVGNLEESLRVLGMDQMAEVIAEATRARSGP